jgi:hypothetical protein
LLLNDRDRWDLGEKRSVRSGREATGGGYDGGATFE